MRNRVQLFAAIAIAAFLMVPFFALPGHSRALENEATPIAEQVTLAAENEEVMSFSGTVLDCNGAARIVYSGVPFSTSMVVITYADNTREIDRFSTIISDGSGSWDFPLRLVTAGSYDALGFDIGIGDLDAPTIIATATSVTGCSPDGPITQPELQFVNLSCLGTGTLIYRGLAEGQGLRVITSINNYFVLNEVVLTPAPGAGQIDFDLRAYDLDPSERLYFNAGTTGQGGEMLLTADVPSCASQGAQVSVVQLDCQGNVTIRARGLGENASLEVIPTWRGEILPSHTRPATQLTTDWTFSIFFGIASEFSLSAEERTDLKIEVFLNDGESVNLIAERSIGVCDSQAAPTWEIEGLACNGSATLTFSGLQGDYRVAVYPIAADAGGEIALDGLSTVVSDASGSLSLDFDLSGIESLTSLSILVFAGPVDTDYPLVVEERVDDCDTGVEPNPEPEEPSEPIGEPKHPWQPAGPAPDSKTVSISKLPDTGAGTTANSSLTPAVVVVMTLFLTLAAFSIECRRQRKRSM